MVPKLDRAINMPCCAELERATPVHKLVCTMRLGICGSRKSLLAASIPRKRTRSTKQLRGRPLVLGHQRALLHSASPENYRAAQLCAVQRAMRFAFRCRQREGEAMVAVAKPEEPTRSAKSVGIPGPVQFCPSTI